MRGVNDAINEILAEEEYFLKRDGFILLRIQDIARKMHPHHWKYRSEILRKIHEWAKQHPVHSQWTDAKGRKYKVGYGEQMHPIYGTFEDSNNYIVGKSSDILELILLRPAGDTPKS